MRIRIVMTGFLGLGGHGISLQPTAPPPTPKHTRTHTQQEVLFYPGTVALNCYLLAINLLGFHLRESV